MQQPRWSNQNDCLTNSAEEILNHFGMLAIAIDMQTRFFLAADAVRNAEYVQPNYLLIYIGY